MWGNCIPNPINSYIIAKVHRISCNYGIGINLWKGQSSFRFDWAPLWCECAYSVAGWGRSHNMYRKVGMLKGRRSRIIFVLDSILRNTRRLMKIRSIELEIWLAWRPGDLFCSYYDKNRDWTMHGDEFFNGCFLLIFCFKFFFNQSNDPNLNQPLYFSSVKDRLAVYHHLKFTKLLSIYQCVSEISMVSLSDDI